MLSRFAGGLRCGRIAYKALSRNIGISSVCYQKAQASVDPIQKLFIDKIHEYAQKSKWVSDFKF